MQRTVTTVERYEWDAKSKAWRAVEKTVTTVDGESVHDPFKWPDRFGTPPPYTITWDTKTAGGTIRAFN